MIPTSTSIYHWPRLPDLPPVNQPVLVRVATASARPAARRALRAVLREILAFWSGLPPDRLPLRESPRGPVWPGQLADHPLDISLSYAENEGWIALLRGGRIGLDVMTLAPVDEMAAVSRHYFNPVVSAMARGSVDPGRAFAGAWTDLEARVKCLKLDLSEWYPGRDLVLARCDTRSYIESERLVVTIAVDHERIAGARLDVFSTEPPLPDDPGMPAKNCVITPHVGWATADARTRLLQVAAENLRAWQSGHPQNVVNRS